MLNAHEEISFTPSTSDYEKSTTDIIHKNNSTVKNLHLRSWKDLIQDLFSKEKNMLNAHEEISFTPSTSDYEKSTTDIIHKNNSTVKNLHLRSWKGLIQDLFSKEKNMLNAHEEISFTPSTSDYEKSTTDIIHKKNNSIKNLHLRSWKGLIEDLFSKENNMLNAHEVISFTPSTSDYEKSATDIIHKKNNSMKNLHLRTWKGLIQDLFSKEKNMLNAHEEISFTPSTSDYEKSTTDIIHKNNSTVKTLHVRSWKGLIQDLFSKEKNMLNAHEEISFTPSTSDYEKSTTDIIHKNNSTVKNLHLRSWKGLIQDLFSKEKNMLNAHEEISFTPSTSDYEKSTTDIIHKKNNSIKNLHLRSWKGLIEDLFSKENNMLNAHEVISFTPSTSDYEKSTTDIIHKKNNSMKNLHLRSWKDLIQDLFSKEKNMLNAHEEISFTPSKSVYEKSTTDSIHKKNNSMKNLHLRTWKGLIQDLFSKEKNMLIAHEEISFTPSTSDYEKSTTDIIYKKNNSIKNLHLRSWKDLIQDLFSKEKNMLNAHEEISFTPSKSDYEKSTTDIIHKKNNSMNNLHLRSWKDLIQDLFSKEKNMLNAHEEISFTPSKSVYEKSTTDSIHKKNNSMKNLHLRTWKGLIQDLFSKEKNMLNAHEEISFTPSTSDYEKSTTDIIYKKNNSIKNLHLRSWKDLIQDLFSKEKNMLNAHEEISFTSSTNDYEKSTTDIIHKKNNSIKNLHLRKWKGVIQDLFSKEKNIMNTHQNFSSETSTSDNEKSVTDIINKENIPIKNLQLRTWKDLIQDLFSKETNVLSAHQEISSKPSHERYHYYLMNEYQKSQTNINTSQDILAQNEYLQTLKNLTQYLLTDEKQLMHKSKDLQSLLANNILKDLKNTEGQFMKSNAVSSQNINTNKNRSSLHNEGKNLMKIKSIKRIGPHAKHNKTRKLYLYRYPQRSKSTIQKSQFDINRTNSDFIFSKIFPTKQNFSNLYSTSQSSNIIIKQYPFAKSIWKERKFHQNISPNSIIRNKHVKHFAINHNKHSKAHPLYNLKLTKGHKVEKKARKSKKKKSSIFGTMLSKYTITEEKNFYQVEPTNLSSDLKFRINNGNNFTQVKRKQKKKKTKQIKKFHRTTPINSTSTLTHNLSTSSSILNDGFKIWNILPKHGRYGGIHRNKKKNTKRFSNEMFSKNKAKKNFIYKHSEQYKLLPKDSSKDKNIGELLKKSSRKQNQFEEKKKKTFEVETTESDLLNYEKQLHKPDYLFKELPIENLWWYNVIAAQDSMKKSTDAIIDKEFNKYTVKESQILDFDMRNQHDQFEVATTVSDFSKNGNQPQTFEYLKEFKEHFPIKDLWWYNEMNAHEFQNDKNRLLTEQNRESNNILDVVKLNNLTKFLINEEKYEKNPYEKNNLFTEQIREPDTILDVIKFNNLTKFLISEERYFNKDLDKSMAERKWSNTLNFDPDDDLTKSSNIKDNFDDYIGNFSDKSNLIYRISPLPTFKPYLSHRNNQTTQEKEVNDQRKVEVLFQKLVAAEKQPIEELLPKHITESKINSKHNSINGLLSQLMSEEKVQVEKNEKLKPRNISTQIEKPLSKEESLGNSKNKLLLKLRNYEKQFIEGQTLLTVTEHTNSSIEIGNENRTYDDRIKMKQNYSTGKCFWNLKITKGEVLLVKTKQNNMIYSTT
ncbi:hypothetical protein CDAR_612271 [Caerostris darwini]|uniref:Uncharacterized protein n=1 Tax=Caerostris darwini TaxID=1538125 RepID=A0AAV4S2W3_9ARAC|nr:hypothetical protein CDAR_612271 [Caerostris darwini]